MIVGIGSAALAVEVVHQQQLFFFHHTFYLFHNDGVSWRVNRFDGARFGRNLFDSFDNRRGSDGGGCCRGSHGKLTIDPI